MSFNGMFLLYQLKDKTVCSFFTADIQRIISELNIYCQIFQLPKFLNLRPLLLAAIKSVAAVTLDLREGNATLWRSDRCFETRVVLTRLPLHHMSCKVCETLKEIAMFGLYKANGTKRTKKTLWRRKI